MAKSDKKKKMPKYLQVNGVYYKKLSSSDVRKIFGDATELSNAPEVSVQVPASKGEELFRIACSKYTGPKIFHLTGQLTEEELNALLNPKMSSENDTTPKDKTTEEL